MVGAHSRLRFEPMELVRCGGGGGEERVGGPNKGACEASPSRLENLSHLVAHRRPVRVHLEGEDAVSRYTADLTHKHSRDTAALTLTLSAAAAALALATIQIQPRCSRDATWMTMWKVNFSRRRFATSSSLPFAAMSKRCRRPTAYGSQPVSPGCWRAITCRASPGVSRGAVRNEAMVSQPILALSRLSRLPRR